MSQSRKKIIPRTDHKPVSEGTKFCDKLAVNHQFMMPLENGRQILPTQENRTSAHYTAGPDI